MLADLKEPCRDCPFRRKSVPGWLGADTPENFIETTLADYEMPCHLTVNYEDPAWFQDLSAAQACAGASIFFANICKLSRDPKRLKLPPDTEKVFASKTEFLTHHERGLK